MARNVMILCDSEEDYAYQIAAFLDKDKDFPWEILVYTGRQQVELFLSTHSADVLMIAESLFAESIFSCPVEQIVLLNESGTVKCQDVININKYQAAENVKKELLSLYVRKDRKVYPTLQKTQKAKVIGMFSPVRRCLQTTFAITYGQLLAQKGRVLYLNFEYFAGIPEFCGSVGGTDMAALLYYLNAEQDRFALRLKSMLRSVGTWDYIMPMFNNENLTCTTAQEWMNLIGKCVACGQYDAVVLDLTESMQGVFEILRMCDRIITLVKEDSAAKCKLQRYEYLLDMKECNDIKEKSRKILLPQFLKLPASLEEHTKGELAEFVRNILRDEREVPGGIRTVETDFT